MTEASANGRSGGPLSDLSRPYAPDAFSLDLHNVNKIRFAPIYWMSMSAKLINYAAVMESYQKAQDVAKQPK